MVDALRPGTTVAVAAPSPIAAPIAAAAAIAAVSTAVASVAIATVGVEGLTITLVVTAVLRFPELSVATIEIK